MWYQEYLQVCGPSPSHKYYSNFQLSIKDILQTNYEFICAPAQRNDSVGSGAHE